jgi:DNA (cytosine-5)-methyltransferase 1
VLFDLEGLGYACAAAVIPACAVDAPHRRDRAWIMAHARSSGREERHATTVAVNAEQRTRRAAHAGCVWSPESPLDRVANGVPQRVDRLRGLGNAIVPAVAEEIMRALAQADL